MQVIARAPNRIDLAGGTLDLYPLNLLMGGGLTVNAAVTIESLAIINSRCDLQVVLRSLDGGTELTAPSYDSLPTDQSLELLVRTVQYARPAVGIEVSTHNQAPKGSGLGASSALAIALCAGLAVMGGRPYAKRELVRVAADLETQILGIPAGRQDHYAAAVGGINTLWFEVSGDRIESLDSSGRLAADLSQRMVIAYTGQTRLSARNNWDILRMYIDGQPLVRRAMAGILEAAHGVRQALIDGPDWDAAGAWINQEWRCRRQLAAGVSSPAIDAMIAAALEAGATGAKLCGAGGGGCFFALVPPARRGQVEAAVRQQGALPLPARVCTKGLSVEVSGKPLL